MSLLLLPLLLSLIGSNGDTRVCLGVPAAAAERPFPLAPLLELSVVPSLIGSAGDVGAKRSASRCLRIDSSNTERLEPSESDAGGSATGARTTCGRGRTGTEPLVGVRYDDVCVAWIVAYRNPVAFPSWGRECVCI